MHDVLSTVLHGPGHRRHSAGGRGHNIIAGGLGRCLGIEVPDLGLKIPLAVIDGPGGIYDFFAAGIIQCFIDLQKGRAILIEVSFSILVSIQLLFKGGNGSVSRFVFVRVVQNGIFQPVMQIIQLLLGVLGERFSFGNTVEIIYFRRVIAHPHIRMVIDPLLIKP